MMKSKSIKTELEIQKCKEDPFYFMENYLIPKVVVSEETKSFFRKLWQAQEKGKRVIIHKGRFSHFSVIEKSSQYCRALEGTEQMRGKGEQD